MGSSIPAPRSDLRLTSARTRQRGAGLPGSTPSGALVIIGGGLRADNADVWQRIVHLAGGAGARIAVFGSASINPEKSAQKIIGKLQRYGADGFFVPVAVKLEGSDYRKAADSSHIAAMVRSAGGVYFGGGDQRRITQALLRADGSRTAVLDAVWALYQDGGVIAGSSAGAAIMSSTMFYRAKPVLDTLKLGLTEGREIAAGLGFIGDDIFIDQHVLTRGRFARMLPAMLKKGYQTGLGIDENSALVVDARREVEVVGRSGALFIDLAVASGDKAMKDFNVSNATISYLDRGDKFNLLTGVFTPSTDKAGERRDLARYDRPGPVFSDDILGHNALLELMDKLIDTAEQEAIGIAFGNARDPAPHLGFEFRFRKTADSVAYGTAEAPAYSVLKLQLDVRPLTLPQPLQHNKQS